MLQTYFNIYCVPTGPLRSRMIFWQFEKEKPNKQIMEALKPVFFEHLLPNDLFDGGNFFLHRQENTTRHANEPDMHKMRQNFMPGKVNAGVITFRSWLETKGGKGPHTEDGSLLLGKEKPDLTREVAFDRCLRVREITTSSLRKNT